MKALAKTTLRSCTQGHQYYKSSDCPTCPICEAAKKPTNGFLSLSAPAIRALHNANINSLQQLSTYTENDILHLHGMGKASIPKLKAALEKEGLAFRE